MINLISLLKTKDFSMKIPENYIKPLLQIKNKELSVGKIVDLTDMLTFEAQVELNKYKIGELKHEPQPDKVNEFLLKIRQEFWN